MDIYRDLHCESRIGWARRKHNCTMKIFIVAVFLHLTGAQSCTSDLLCTCYRYYDLFNIDCDNVTSLDLEENHLLSQFADLTINELNFKEGCDLVSLPDFAFHNCSIRFFKAFCPFSDISVDAFSGISFLTEICLYGTTFSTIPEGLLHLTFLKTLCLRYSNFSQLHRELWNLTSLALLDFANGVLEQLSPEAFIRTPNIQSLNFSYNSLRYIHPDTLKPLTVLQKIYLRGNQIFTVDGLFRNPNLQVIDLYDNKLLSLADAFPEDLWAMQKLNIGKNPLQSINSSAFGFKFHQLRLFDASDTRCYEIDNKLLHSFPYVEKVFFGGNHIHSVPKHFFHNLAFLKSIDLTNNNITSTDGLFQNNPKIKHLSLAINGISDIKNSFRGLTELKKLNLSTNYIEHIDGSCFLGLENLRFVDLSHNMIRIIDSNSFSWLPKLKVLDLSFNALERLNKSMQNLYFLKVLHIDANNLEEVDSEEFLGLTKLDVLTLRDNRITSLNGVFGKLYRISSLNISNNHLRTLSRDTFPEDINALELSLAKNAWECDCRLTWMLKWLADKNNSTLLDNPICFFPERLKGKSFHDLTVTDVTEWPEDDCPVQCICECVTLGRNFYVRTNCSFRKLAQIPSTFTQHLGDLDVSGNELGGLGNFSANLYKELFILNLENNRILEIDVDLLPRDLKVLKLSGNLLNRLPWQKVSNDSVQVLTLSGNPWICDCETIGFKRWLLSEDEKVVDVNETRCGANGPLSKLYGKAIISLQDNDLCPSVVSLYVALALAILGFLLLATSFVLAYSKYRVYIKIWLYAHGFTWVKEDDADTDKLFDGVLSYSPLDEIFVLNDIAPGLEETEPKFTLCIPERDIVGGVYTVLTTMKAVHDSKRIIIILDRDYINDEFCMSIFRQAFQQSLEDKINRMIVIKVGEIPPVDVKDPDLKVTLESTRCIVWGETLFWEKLRFAMPKKPRDESIDSSRTVSKHFTSETFSHI